MNTYMLILHEKPADAAPVTAAQMQEIVERYKAWSAGLAERGLLVGGEKLSDDGGRHLRLNRAGQVLATDGPYAEAHDVVGGYFLVKANDDAAAQALAQTCPHLVGSQWIEIRRVDVV